MGSKVSSFPPLDEHTASIMGQYNIESHHIAKLYCKFIEYDEDFSGTWSLAEFNRYLHNYPDTLISPALEALVKLSSSSRDSKLTFVDFLISICSFCALSREELLQFLYIVIDYDRSGVLDRGEVYAFFSANVRMRPLKKHLVAKQIRKRCIYPPNYTKALEEFQNGEWKSLIFEEFCQMCDLFPHLSFPVFYLQDQLRRRVIGSSFWQKWDTERLKIFHLESESKSVKFKAKSLTYTDRVVDVVKPGRVSMKEIFEFTKRNGLRDRQMSGNQPLTTNENNTNGQLFTVQRDAILSRAPILNLIRNPISVYFVPLDHGLNFDDPPQESNKNNQQSIIQAQRRGAVLGALDEHNQLF